MHKKISLIALDLDGTLALDNHLISKKTKQALQSLHSDGMHIVISTGRRFRTAQYVIDNLDLEVYCICNGGALVKNEQQETILNATLTKQEFVDVIELARSHSLAIAGQRDAHSLGGSDFIIDNKVPWHDGILSYHENNIEYARGADLLAEQDIDQENFLALSTFDEMAKLKGFVEAVEKDERFNVVVVSQVNGDAHYCEITQRHVDKWYGLQHLAKRFNLEAANICAVGDELNDVPMVKAAGLGVAMGNAHPKLKNLADFICGNYDEDGLLELFEYIREHNSQL
ncbi:MAG: Cof subfamily protein (haloacid dehalogenase superfamily) [Candidatus Azotimanducaceae bacterium]|jgi:Cof subfamily protein (haloacid dehalogenase superfamily)